MIYENPVFSIITPTFRRPEMLVRNIKSVLNQTFSNFEHIIIDDDNDPATEKIIESFNDDRLILIKHNQPRGAAAAYNTGIRKSRGEFISFLDDDDEYKPWFLERIQERFLNSGKNCGFIWTGIERVLDSESGERVISKLLWPAVFTNKEKGLVAATSIGNGYGVCVRKRCIDDKGLYDENLLVAEDTDFLIRLSQKSEFQTIPEVLVRLHRHESNQLTRKENYNERIHGKETILNRYTAFFEKYPLLYIEHYRGYAGLCYKSGLKKKGRNAFLSIFRKRPFRIIVYLDFLLLEFSGIFFSEINFVKKIKIIWSNV